MQDIFDDFNLERVSPSIIMAIGVGGAGGNAVNHMYDLGIRDVAFMVCNTDKQALDRSMVPIKVQLGTGLGAGNDPEKGRAAAIPHVDEISAIFKEHGIKMVFITAGMGGGTGTGAAPIIAKAAKDAGILTVGIVTMPDRLEGVRRTRNAEAGLEELRKNVDSIIVINNENIKDMYGNLAYEDAYNKANDILATAAKGIAEIITNNDVVNIDFADVSTVMRDSGKTLMGYGRAFGEDRVKDAIEMAAHSPLLNHNSIDGARDVLVNVSYDNVVMTMDEQSEILQYIQDHASKQRGTNNVPIIWGAGKVDYLGDDIQITIIATRFKDEDDIVVDHHISDNPFDESALSAGKDKKKKGSAGDVIIIKDDNRYKDITHILNTPAYVRRKVKLNNADKAKRQSKVSLKEEAPKPQEPQDRVLEF
jgi:cell division protein FtsZ